MSSSSSPTQPLASRDINAPSPTKPNSSDGQSTATEKEAPTKPKSMEYHRQVLQSRLDEDK